MRKELEAAIAKRAARIHDAADAGELMHAGTECPREHMLPEQRIHWVTLNEATALNVVPDLSRTWYYVRSQGDFIRPLYEPSWTAPMARP